jgi:hypothetical protein
MTQFEKLKNDINECKSPMELIGLLVAFELASKIYCIENNPDEIVFRYSGAAEVTTHGMESFLESSIEN